MTDFLVIAGLPVLIAEGQVVERVERAGVSDRTWNDGTLITDVLWEKREWAMTTSLMTQADVDTLRAAVALGAHVTCSGNALGGSVTCQVDVGDAGYINVVSGDGKGFLRALALTLREV
jgi:hypothetical protein